MALGVGGAVLFAGQGVASADANSPTAQQNSGPEKGSGAPTRSGLCNVKIKKLAGRHRESADTPSSTTVGSILQRLSDVRDKGEKAVADAKRDLSPAGSATPAALAAKDDGRRY